MRVQRGFGFVDLSGFTSYTDVHGDDRAGTLLAAFRTVVREVASRRGVRIAKWQGDGAMFVSVERGPLVECVLEIEHKVATVATPLRLRTGLTSGAVILFEGDDYIGSAVNLAARLCDAAGPGETLAATELAGCIPPWAEAEAGHSLEVRGFGHPVPVVRICRREPNAALVDPVCHLPLPEDGVVAWRGELPFCSTSCCEVWDDAQRPSRPMAAG